MSELDGILLGAAMSAAFLREWLEEEVLMEFLDITEVFDVTEELLEADDLTVLPRVKDCSLNCWVLVVPAICKVGLPEGDG